MKKKSWKADGMMAAIVVQQGDTTMATKTIKIEESTITRAQVIALRNEAAAAGDTAQVELCTRALNGATKDSAASWRECERVIANAQAQ